MRKRETLTIHKRPLRATLLHFRVKSVGEGRSSLNVPGLNRIQNLSLFFR